MTTRHPLYFNPGDDETRLFEYKDPATGAIIPLTGYSATWVGKVFNTTVSVPGTVDGVNGIVQVVVSDTQTTSLGAAGVFGSYTLKVTKGPDTFTIAEGPLLLLPS